MYFSRLYTAVMKYEPKADSEPRQQQSEREEKSSNADMLYAVVDKSPLRAKMTFLALDLVKHSYVCSTCAIRYILYVCTYHFTYIRTSV